MKTAHTPKNQHKTYLSLVILLFLGLAVGSCGGYYEEYWIEESYEEPYYLGDISYIRFDVRTMESPCNGIEFGCGMKSSQGIEVTADQPFTSDCEYYDRSTSCGDQHTVIECYSHSSGVYGFDLVNYQAFPLGVRIDYSYYQSGAFSDAAINGFIEDELLGHESRYIPIEI